MADNSEDSDNASLRKIFYFCSSLIHFRNDPEFDRRWGSEYNGKTDFIYKPQDTGYDSPTHFQEIISRDVNI
jgi:hypothetical protein